MEKKVLELGRVVIVAMGMRLLTWELTTMEVRMTGRSKKLGRSNLWPMSTKLFLMSASS
jgi:hypothetical protein